MNSLFVSQAYCCLRPSPTHQPQHSIDTSRMAVDEYDGVFQNNSRKKSKKRNNNNNKTIFKRMKENTHPTSHIKLPFLSLSTMHPSAVMASTTNTAQAHTFPYFYRFSNNPHPSQSTTSPQTTLHCVSDMCTKGIHVHTHSSQGRSGDNRIEESRGWEKRMKDVRIDGGYVGDECRTDHRPNTTSTSKHTHTENDREAC